MDWEYEDEDHLRDLVYNSAAYAAWLDSGRHHIRRPRGDLVDPLVIWRQPPSLAAWEPVSQAEGMEVLLRALQVAVGNVAGMLSDNGLLDDEIRCDVRRLSIGRRA